MRVMCAVECHDLPFTLHIIIISREGGKEEALDLVACAFSIELMMCVLCADSIE